MADRFSNRPSFADNFDRAAPRPPADAQPDSDPLAELARLIGQTDPQSNFARGRQSSPSNPPQAPRSLATDFSAGPPSWLQTAQAQQQGRAQPTFVEQEQQHEAEPELTPMPAFLQTPHAQHGQYASQAPTDRYDQVLYGQDDQQQQDDGYSDQGYMDEEYAEEQFDGPPAFVETENRRRRPGGLLTVAVVLGLAVVGTAGAYAYRSYSGSPRSGTPPIIKADNAPSKVVPPTQPSDNSGKLIYDRIGNSSGPERVVSREEQPVDVNASAPRPAFPPVGQGGMSTQQASSAPADDNGGDAPRKIRTVPIRGDQANGAPVTTRPAPAAVRTIPVAPAPSTQASANAPMSLTPNASTPSTVRSASAAVPPEAAAPPTNVTRTTGGYLVQIASQKTEAEAQASFRVAQAKFANLIGTMSPVIRRADLGDRGVFYRAMVGPFATQEEAKRLCSNLTIAGGDKTCVVQRN